MKPWQLSKRVNDLSEMFKELPKTDTTIDWNCLSEPERQLLNKVEEIIDKYAQTAAENLSQTKLNLEETV